MKGYCSTLVTLNIRYNTSAQELREVIVHELCHAEVYQYGNKDPLGSHTLPVRQQFGAVLFNNMMAFHTPPRYNEDQDHAEAWLRSVIRLGARYPSLSWRFVKYFKETTCYK